MCEAKQSIASTGGTGGSSGLYHANRQSALAFLKFHVSVPYSLLTRQMQHDTGISYTPENHIRFAPF